MALAVLTIMLGGAILPLRAPSAEATTLGYARAYSGSTSSDSAEGYGIGVDGSGNAYLTGDFRNTVDFDPGAGVSTLTGVGGGIDGYITRLDASGNIRGLNIVVNGSGTDAGFGVAVDASGNSYFSGSFIDTSTGNQSQAYAIKLDTAGSIVWSKFFGGTGSAGGAGIAVDESGNVYLTGSFSGAVDFDPGAGTVSLTSNISGDVFAVKLNSSGELQWVKRFGEISTFPMSGPVAVDVAGNVYLTGTFQETMDLDPGPGTAFLTSPGSFDVFAVKLNSSGDFIWAKQFRGGGYDEARGIAVDGAGNVVITGSFEDTADFDPGPGTANLTSAGSYDAFVVKLDSGGNLDWAKRLGGTAADQSLGMALDDSGNVYLCGYFSGTADFDPGAGTFSLTSAGGQDAFAAKLDATGAFVWAERFGGGALDQARGIAQDESGGVYLTGIFRGAVTFAPSSGGSTSLTSNVGDPTKPAAFIVKLAQVAPPVNGRPAAQQSTPDNAALVFSTARGNRISLTDGDNGSTPLRVTLSVTSGTLSLATTAGLSFTAGDGTTDATMTFSGTLTAINTALDGLTFAPVAGGPASVTLQVTSRDVDAPSGGQTDSDTITIQRRPIAVNDSYTVSNGSTLSVPAATGVNVNDTDDTASSELTAQVVSAPGYGTLSLQPTGAFTYTPKANFGGTDFFTYKVTDAQTLESNTATVSITVNPVSCGPRPGVTVTNTVNGGALESTITASGANAPGNALTQLRFGTFTNAVVTLNGQTITSGQTVTLPASTTSVTLTVRRATAGQVTTVPLTAVDGCGEWPTFVGGGVGAGF